jgi:hypothetical protein
VAIRDKLDLVANEAGVTDSGVLHHAKIPYAKPCGRPDRPDRDTTTIDPQNLQRREVDSRLRIIRRSSPRLRFCYGATVGRREAMRLVNDAVGTSSIRTGQPFERHFRDVHVLLQHSDKSSARYVQLLAAGRVVSMGTCTLECARRRECGKPDSSTIINSL